MIQLEVGGAVQGLSGYGLVKAEAVFDASQDSRDLSFHQSFQTGFGVHPAHIQSASSALLQVVKRLCRKSHHR